jgi:CRP-like cAMP-binding protein
VTDSDAVPIGYVCTQLRGVDLLRVLDDEVLDRIAERVTVSDHEPGSVVVAEGDDAAGLFLVFRGSAVVERAGVPVAVIGPGEHVGEIALLDGEPRMATVRAQHDLRTGFLPSADFLDVLEQSPEVALQMLATLAGRFRMVEQQLAEVERQLVEVEQQLAASSRDSE